VPDALEENPEIGSPSLGREIGIDALRIDPDESP